MTDAADNCPWTPNPDQSDLDDDGMGDECGGIRCLHGGCDSTGGAPGSALPLLLLLLAARSRRRVTDR